MNPIPTKEQNSAIKSGKGPILIIAGAGTGKTFTITERILYLINEKKVSPEKILALTFTEKAAFEMQDRVERRLPLGFPEINISTFHSFCDRFLKEEAINVGMSPEYKLMTSSDEVFFIREHLFDFDLDILRPKGNPTKFAGELVKHISRLQDENITPEDYEEYFKKLSTVGYQVLVKKRNQEAGSRDPLTESSQLEADRSKLKELTDFYRDYTKLKETNDRMSFGDLIHKTYTILKTRKDIRANWQSRFDYILIDEFQDTNFAQYELIKLLLANNKNSNIMVVADDDQSIYKFRGAAVSNVLEFSKDFPDAKRFVLTENRRSVQTVLDKSYQLIQNNNPDRLEIKEKVEKKLIAVNNSHLKFPSPVEFRYYLSAEDEAEGIATEITDITKEENAIFTEGEQLSLERKGSGVQFRDISILVRSHAHSEIITSALKRHGIPYQFSGARKLFNREEVKELMNYLKIAANYTDNIAMNGVLDYKIWGMTDREIIELNILARNQKKSIFEIIENTKSGEFKFEVSKIAPIIGYVKKSWQEMRSGESIWQILLNFVNDSGYIKNLSEGSLEKEMDELVVRDVSDEMENELKLKNVARLFDFIDKFEKSNPESKVYEFIDYVDLILKSGDSPLVDDGEYVERNAVNIITVHASKGLEFPIVFIPSCVRGRFPSNDKKDVLEIPEELIKETLPTGDESEQEERRLMYVAVTRAKYKVYLSGSEFYGEGKRKSKISPFIIEMFGEEELRYLIDHPINMNLTLEVVKEKKEEVSEVRRNKLSYLSYSQVDDYKNCPRKYRYKYVLKIPTKPSPALSYGISIHNTLKRFYEKLKRVSSSQLPATSNPKLKTQNSNLLVDNEKNFSIDGLLLADLIEIFKEEWVSSGYDNKKHENDTFKKGQIALEKFYNTFFNLSQKPYLLEQPFNIRIGDVTVRGKIDRLDSHQLSAISYQTETGKRKQQAEGRELPSTELRAGSADSSYEIIDYKTGDTKRTQTQVNGDMQLAIYALAVEQVFKIKADKLTLIFVDQNEKISADMEKIEKLKEKVIEEIGQVAENINNEKFEAKPGFLCKFCDFNTICKYAQV